MMYKYFGKRLPEKWKEHIKITYDPDGEYVATLHGEEIDRWGLYAIVEKFHKKYGRVEGDEDHITVYDENDNEIDTIYPQDFIPAYMEWKAKKVKRKPAKKKKSRKNEGMRHSLARKGVKTRERLDKMVKVKKYKR